VCAWRSNNTQADSHHRLTPWGRSVRPSVVEIVPGLHIGALPTKRVVRRLVRAGVTHAVDLRVLDAASEGIRWPHGVVRLHRPLIEFAAPSVDTLTLVSSDVAHLVQQGQVVFVHCREGVQRAPMVACAALLRMGWSLAEAHRLVSARRPVMAMSDGQFRVLRQLEDRREQ
jgi:protein-tyrosine phosphatase